MFVAPRGAADQWLWCSEVFPNATQIHDFYPAAEHRKKALNAAYGEGSEEALPGDFRRLRQTLLDDEEGIERVAHSLTRLRRMHPGRKAIAQGVKFFRKQKDRLHYAEYRTRGFPGIGSGVVESTVKALITQRLNGPGMRPSEPGFGQAMLSVRALRKSGRYDAAQKKLMRIMEPEPLQNRSRPEQHNILNMTVN